MTNAEMSTRIAFLEKQIVDSEKRLNELRNGKIKVDPAEKAQVDKLHDQYMKEWKSRRKMVNINASSCVVYSWFSAWKSSMPSPRISHSRQLRLWRSWGWRWIPSSIIGHRSSDYNFKENRLKSFILFLFDQLFGRPGDIDGDSRNVNNTNSLISN